MPDHPEEACVNCHFFSGPGSGSRKTVDDSLRERVREGDFDWGKVEEKLYCSKGVWKEEGVDYDNEDRFREYVMRDRSGECFFWPYTEGMMMGAAEELQEREEERTRFQRRNRWVRLGAIAAILAVIIDAIFRLLRAVIPILPFPF